MERLTTVLKVMGDEKVYYAKGKYGTTTLCAEMETREVRECIKRLAQYENMHEKVIERIEKLKTMDCYPPEFVERTIDVLEWVVSLLN